MPGFRDEEVGATCQTCGPGKSRESKNWIEIELLYEDSKEPVRLEEYCVKLPDGTEVRGHLSESGQAVIDGIPEDDNCEVSFPNIDKRAWKPAE